MKVKYLLLVVFFFIAVGNISAQNTFQKTFGGVFDDWSCSVQQANDTGYLVAGYTASSGSQGRDFYLIKTTKYGDTLWTKTYGNAGTFHGAPYYEECTQMIKTYDNGFILVGNQVPGVTADYAATYAVKINSLGDTLWTKLYVGFDANAIVQMYDSGYVIVGFEASQLYIVFAVLRINSVGDTLWSRTFRTSYSVTAYSVCVTPDSGCIVVGNADQNWDAYIMKLKGDGSIAWIKSYGPKYSLNSIYPTMDNNYILTGSYYAFGPQYAWLIKADLNGNILWAKIYGGSNGDYATSALPTKDKGFILLGSTNFGFGGHDIYLIKTDSTGNLLWSKTYGGTNQDYGSAVMQTIDGGYIISGTTQSFGAGYNDFYLIKTDSMGNSGCNEFTPATIDSIVSPTNGTFSPSLLPFSACDEEFYNTGVLGGAISTPLCITGINENRPFENLLTIFPNPISNVINISLDRNIENGIVNIFNVMGEQVYTDAITGNEKTINCRLPAGVYFVRVTNDERQWVEKLIVE